MKTARVLQGLLPLPLALSCSLAVAQSVGSEGAESDAILEEVLVTANRRVSDLQTTPIAITALTGEGLDQLFANDIGDIAWVTPNFSSASVTGFNAAGFAIRGAGQTDILVYWEPPVGVIVDDFVVPQVQTQLLAAFDIESVEVLRGPQGTLFGKNTTAGAVVVRTKKPQLGETTVDARLRLGNYGVVEPRLAVNLPMGDEFAFRLAAMSQQSDGYYRNGKVSPGQLTEPTNERIGGNDNINARAKLLWEPTEDLTVLFQYEYLKDRSDSPPAVNTTDPNSPQAFNFIGFPGITGGDPLDQAGISNRDFIDGPGSETTGLFMTDGHQIDVDGYYLNIDWQFGDYILSSVTGQRNQDSRLPSTYTGERYASLFDATRDDQRETFQQEVRLTSYFSGNTNFVAGVFYQTDKTSFNVLQYLGILDFFGTSVPGVLDNNNPLIISNNQDMQSLAGFFDMSYDFADTWQIAGGVRYTHEEKEFFSRPGTPIIVYGQTPGDYPFDPNNTAQFPCTDTTPCTTDKQTWDEPTYRIMLSNQFTDDVYGYASYSHGFKSGGYSDQAGSGLQVPLARTAYQPETADSFEIGSKMDLMGGRARMNIAVFHVTYEDMQRAAIASTSAGLQETVVFNAAQVPAYGVEFEGSYLITDDLVLRGNVGWLKAKYDEFLLDLNLDGEPDQDLSGRPVTRAPEWTAGIDLTWTKNLSNGSNIRSFFGIYYEDENTYYYSGDGEQFDTFIESHTLFDANVTWTSPTGDWWVSLYGKNLTDERYKSASQYVGGLWTFSTYAPPLTYGMEVGFFWDR